MVQNPVRDPAVTVGIGGDASELSTAVDTAVGSLNKLKQTAGVAAGALAAIGAAGISASVSAFGDFDAAMQQSVAVMGDVDEAMRGRLEETARQVATSTTQSHEQAAESFYFLASAGLDAAESMEAMPKVANLAEAGQMDMAQATDYATDIMSAFGKQADELDEVTDSLTGTVTRHNQTMKGMGEAMSMVAPIASGLGMSIEETSAAIGVMGDAGIKGSRAGRTLRQALNRLSSPTNAMQETLSELGVSVRDSEGNMRSLTGILRDLEDAGATTSDIMELFGARAGPGLQVLLDEGADAIEAETEKIEDMDGVTEDVADTQRQTLNRQLDIFKSRLNDVAVAIGSGFVGPLVDALGWVNIATKRFGDYIDTMDDTRLAMDLTGGTIAALGVSIAALVSGPIGLLVGAIGGLAIAWGEDWGEIRSITNAVVTEIVGDAGDTEDAIESIRSTVKRTVNGVRSRLRQVRSVFNKQLLSPARDADSEFGSTLRSMRREVGQTFSTVREIVGSSLDIVLNRFIRPTLNQMSQLWETHLAGSDGIVANARTAFNTLWKYIIRPTLNVIQGAWDHFGDNLLQTASGVLGTLKTVFVIGMDAILTAINVVLDLISGDWQGAWNHLKGFASRTVENIASWLQTSGKDLFAGAFGLIIDAIKAPFKALYNWLFGNSLIKDLINDPVDWIKSTGKSKIGGAFDALVGAIKAPFSGLSLSINWPSLPGWLQDAMNKAGGGLQDAVDYVQNLDAGGGGGSSGGGGGGGGGGGNDDECGSDSDCGANSICVDGECVHQGYGGTVLDTGGYVEETGMALIHAGERVVPDAQVSDRGGIEAGTTIVIESIQASGRREGREAGRALKAELRRFDI